MLVFLHVTIIPTFLKGLGALASGLHTARHHERVYSYFPIFGMNFQLELIHQQAAQHLQYDTKRRLRPSAAMRGAPKPSPRPPGSRLAFVSHDRPPVSAPEHSPDLEVGG